MFFLLLKKNYSISILHGSESLPVVVITIHPPKGRQATKGQPKDGEFTSLACRESEAQPLARSADHRSAVAANVLPELVWQSGASWQDKRSGTRCKHLVYLVCQICGYDTLSRMPDRGLKGAKAPSQVSKVSR